MSKKFELFLILSLYIVIFCTPVSEDGSKQNGKITKWMKTKVSSNIITATGRDIVTGGDVTPIDEMKIQIPENSYGQRRTFSISFSPVISHKFVECFNPVAPLIKISNGGGHTIIDYKIDYNGGKLYMTDPDFPDNK